jgi:di/tricarboxylate transporter
MTFSYLVVALTLLGAIALLASNRIRPIMIFGGAAGLLYTLGVLSFEQAAGNLVNPSLITLVALILVSVALERVSVVSRLCAYAVGSKTSPTLNIFRLGALAGSTSSVLSNTAVVSTLMSGLRGQRGLDNSKLLLPLSYASIAGGMITLVGTSTNLIVNSFVEQAGFEPLGFFDFTLIGLPVFLVTLVTLCLVSQRMLPKRDTTEVKHGRDDYLFERRVITGSALIGKSVTDNGLRNLQNVFLVEVMRGTKTFTPVTPDFIIAESDVLAFSGDPAFESILNRFDGLVFQAAQNHQSSPLVQVVISPSSALVGQTLKDSDFRSRFDAAVISIRCGSHNVRGRLGHHVLSPGDSLLLAVGPGFVASTESGRDFIAVQGIERHEPLSALKSSALMIGFLAVLVGAALELLPLIKGLMILLSACVLFGLVKLSELKVRFPFEIIVVVAGALCLSEAMVNVGMTEDLSQWLQGIVGSLSLMAALAVVYFAAWATTELITNNAAAALMFPISLATADAMQASPYPFFMALAFGASASFLSPYGYQTNLMVYSAGNYRLSDYLRCGAPTLVAYSATALMVIPLVFPF